MKFLFLCEPETEGLQVRWSESATKSRKLIEAGGAAGFTDREIKQSPIGILETDLVWGHLVAKAGAIVLIGINGSLLIETAE